MMPTFPVKDLMDRTMQNLKFVRTPQKDFKPWEVTQLLNSFLGAFIHVKEAFYQYIPQDPLPKSGWPVIQTGPGYCAPKDLRDFINLVRNALAHGNIEFISDGHNDIGAIHIWNIRSGAKMWEAQILVTDVELLLNEFVKLMTPILERHEVKP